jgi:hypothetical protein
MHSVSDQRAALLALLGFILGAFAAFGFSDEIDDFFIERQQPPNLQIALDEFEQSTRSCYQTICTKPFHLNEFCRRSLDQGSTIFLEEHDRDYHMTVGQERSLLLAELLQRRAYIRSFEHQAGYSVYGNNLCGKEVENALGPNFQGKK